MARGGSRQGAGRKPGSVSKIDEKARKVALAQDISPLDFLLKAMRDEQQDFNVRMDAAKAAASYVHAKLSSIEQKHEITQRNVVAMPDRAPSVDEWKENLSGRH